MSYTEYTVRVYENGKREWQLDGKLHREDGPAIEWADGTRDWWIDGKLHRENGPAIEWTDGSRWWLVDNKLHREDGPAVEYSTGDREWWVNGKKLSEAEFNQRMNTCDKKIVEIDGVKYQLQEI